MTALPTGTVTFLFTDLEGSTRLWEQHPDAMPDAVARHDALLRDVLTAHHGVQLSSMGDGIAAVFASASDAACAALDAQQRLAAEPWPETGPLISRMGLHAGEGRMRADGEYENRPLNRCARLMSIGHGGQVLLSDTVEALTRDALPDGAGVLALGPHRLRDLAEPVQVFQLVHPDFGRDFPPLRSLDVLPGNLPRQVTSFVGRETEIADLSALVRERPLVTITGVGGVGKTRLALQVAAEVAADFPGGAWLCELAGVTEGAAIWEVVAAALDVRPGPGQAVEAAVLQSLASKRLLVLDNCEHLLDDAAAFVDAVGRACPEAAILATSREGLAVAGERIVAIPSLGIGGVESDCVRLFAERAAAASHGFTLTSENADAVMQLCGRLDGIPLAIELAAARVRALSPHDLVDRLDQRFKLLTRGSRAARGRQQTLRSAIDWSYELLTSTEQKGFDRLAVFAGGFTLDAAEAVVADAELDAVDVDEVVASLVDKSLVAVDPDADTPRFRLLETIRQYAEEQLEEKGETAAVRRRHAEHYAMFAEEAGRRLRSSDQLAWMARVDAETDNLRAAVDYAADEEDFDLAARIVASLAVTGIPVGHAAMAWAERASTMEVDRAHRLLPEVLCWAAWGAVMHGDLARGEALVARCEDAQHALGVRVPAACMAPATLAFFSQDFEGARHHAEEWVRLARADGDPYGLSQALIMHGAALNIAEFGAGVPLLEEAIEIAREHGIVNSLSIGVSTLGLVVHETDPDRAAVLLEEAIEVSTRIGDRQALSNALASRGWIGVSAGESRVALRSALAAVETDLEIGDVGLMRVHLVLGAVALVELASHEPAAKLLGASAVPAVGGADFGGHVERARGTLRRVLGVGRFEELLARGAALDLRQAGELLGEAAERALRGTPDGE